MQEPISEYYPEQGAFYALHPDIMHTRFEMIMYNSRRDELSELWRQIVGRLEAWHAMFNRFDKESEVGRLNSLQDTLPHAISEEMEQVLELCRGYWLTTEHLFDITRRDMSLVEWGAGRMRKAKPCVTLDFGGFAKGYALLKVGEMLAEWGVKRAIIDFGHSTIMTIGSNPEGEDWAISLPSPYDGREVARFVLNNQTLSTSGNTPSYVGHIVNPQSGERSCDRTLSCVVARNPLDAEVLSTVQMIATDEQMERIVGNFDVVKAKRYFL